MAKRKEDTPSPGSPAWMSTFSDMMNLLLCFFVLLFSMSTVEQDKWDAFVASLNNTFSIFDSGATTIGEGVLISNGVSQLNELDMYLESTGKLADSDVNGEDIQEYDRFDKLDQQAVDQVLEQVEEQNLQNNEELAELIEESVREDDMTDEIEVFFNSRYVQLNMKGAFLFDSGSAELQEASKSVLDKVAVLLEKYAKGIVEIEGHTDNVPMHSAKYADNEQLSSARALAVFYYLTENSRLDPANLRHAGMGERVPIADNSTEEGRSKNRRVEIRIYND